MVSVVSRLVVVLFSVQNVSGGFIAIVLVPRQVNLLLCQDVFVCRISLGHTFSVKEKLEFKRCEDVLEVEKFCYLGDMISFDGASEAVSARIGTA